MPVMIDRSGVMTDVPDAYVQEASGRGYQIVPPETIARLHKETYDKILQKEYGGVGGQVAAGLAGAARGATLGLADAVIQPVFGEAAQLAKEANPLTNTAGELAGIIGGSFVGAAPVSLAAKAGTAASAKVGASILRGLTDTTLKERVAKKLIQGAVAGGVEGGLWGAGQGVSQAAIEESLGNPARLSELVSASVAMNALAGGAFGVAGGALGAGIDGARRQAAKMLPKVAPELGEAADLAILKSYGLDANQASAFKVGIERHGTAEQFDRIVKMSATEGMPDGTAILRKGDDFHTTEARANQALKEWGTEIGKYRDEVDAAGGGISGAALNSRVQQALREKYPKGISFDSSIDPQLRPLLEQYTAGARAKNESARIRLDPQKFNMERLQEFKDRFKKAFGVAEPDGVTTFKKDMSKLIAGIQDEVAAGTLLPDKLARYQKAVQSYADLHDLAKLSEEALGRQPRSTMWKMLGYMGTRTGWMAAGGMWAGVPGAAAASALVAGAPALGSAMVGKQAGMALKLNELARGGAIQNWVTRAESRIAKAAENVGKKGQWKTQATLSLLGLTKQKDPDRAAERLSNRVAQLQADVEAQAQAHDAELVHLDAVAPEAGALARIKLQETYSVIGDALRQNGQVINPLQPLGSQVARLSLAAQRKLEAKLRAIQDPVGVFEAAASGHVNPEQALIVQKLYPELLNHFREVVAEKVANKEQLKSEQLTALSILFGEPMTQLSQSASIQRQQELYLTPKEKHEKAVRLGQSQPLATQRGMPAPKGN